MGVFRDLAELVMVLPGNKAGLFRKKCADYLCRLLSGDKSLIPEILATHESVSEEARDTIMQDVPSSPQLSNVEKRCREENMLLDVQERKVRVMEMNMDFHVKQIKYIESLTGGLDDRDRLYYKDVIKQCAKPGFAAIEDAPGDERGREISIQLVCQELGVNPRGKEGLIGRCLARMYRERYPENPRPPQGDQLYMGKMIKVNKYYQKDYDLAQAAVREVLG